MRERDRGDREGVGGVSDLDAHCLVPVADEHAGVCGAPLPCSAHPPTEPGIYRGLASDGYHRGAGISKSGLDAIARSPAHYRWHREHPEPASAVQRLGIALHCAVLEPEHFASRFTRRPDGVDKRTKAGREFMAGLETGGKVILSAEEWEHVEGMASAIRSHPVASLLIEAGEAETSVYWREGELLCKCRPDWIDTNHDLLIDLKTTRDASFSAFGRACAQYRYHVAAAWYQDGCAVAGIRADSMVFVAVESSAPYCVAAYTLPERAIQIGRTLYRRDLETYARCVRENAWPGYPTEVRELELPKWAEFADIS